MQNTDTTEMIHFRVIDKDTGLVESCFNGSTIAEGARFFREHGLDFSDSIANDLNNKPTFTIIR